MGRWKNSNTIWNCFIVVEPNWTPDLLKTHQIGLKGTYEIVQVFFILGNDQYDSLEVGIHTPKKPRQFGRQSDVLLRTPGASKPQRGGFRNGKDELCLRNDVNIPWMFGVLDSQNGVGYSNSLGILRMILKLHVPMNNLYFNGSPKWHPQQKLCCQWFQEEKPWAFPVATGSYKAWPGVKAKKTLACLVGTSSFAESLGPISFHLLKKWQYLGGLKKRANTWCSPLTHLVPYQSNLPGPRVGTCLGPKSGEPLFQRPDGCLRKQGLMGFGPGVEDSVFLRGGKLGRDLFFW